jgi:hypothetical protein
VYEVLLENLMPYPLLFQDCFLSKHPDVFSAGQSKVAVMQMRGVVALENLNSGPR